MNNSLLYKGFLFLFTLLFCANFSISQQNETVNWKVSTFENKPYLHIKGYNLNQDELPILLAKIQVSANESLIPALQIVSSAPLNSEETGAFKDKLKRKLKTFPEIITRYSFQRKVKYALLTFSPLYLKQGKVYKVTSYKITYKKTASNFPVASRGGSSFANFSVLSDGDIFKFAINSNGVYKLTYEELETNNVLSASINSDLINIYGNHNGMLPERNGDYRLDDLEKNAIKVVDGGDGIFGAGDYILFYGQNPDKWKLNASGNSFYFEKNLYSTESYIFLKINDNSGAKRINTLASSSGTVTNNVSSFDDFLAKEDEYINLMQLNNKGGSGKLWVGHEFDITLSRNYLFSFPNIDLSSNVTINASVYSLTPNPDSGIFLFTHRSNTLRIAVPGETQGTYSAVALNRTGNISFLPTTDQINLNATYIKKAGVKSVGHLDYIEINARRNLTMFGNQMEFRDLNSIGSGNVSKFTLVNANSIDEIWEITTPYSVNSIGFNRSGANLDFTINSDSLRSFIALSGSGYLTTTYKSKVENQNIHGSPTPNLIIVYYPSFEAQVDRLKQFHESNGLSVLKVTVEQIYNEFSGGMQDVTAIKTLAKMFYDRSVGSSSLDYLLLFGDGSFDYKNRVRPNHNFVPVWESSASLGATSSFTSDDFYGLLDDGESMGNSELMDIAVGRLTVTTSSQAQAVVNKILEYQKKGSGGTDQNTDCNSPTSNSSYGDWRNKLVFVTDDVDNNWEFSFFTHAEKVANILEVNYPTFNIEKIYTDAYKQTSVSGGERYREGEERIQRSVQEGALITLYEGHGGEVGWASERILSLPVINGWTNRNRLSVFLTATCEFTKYDDPIRVSAGEQCLLNPNGATVALFTTTRAVGSGSNENLIDAFFEEVFVKKADGKPRTLGEIYMETKNNSKVIGQGDARKFGLIGDPALQLAFPKHKVVTTEVNNTQVSSSIDTLKALSKITVKGQVEDVSGTILTSYNGVVYPTVYDKPSDLKTLGNKSPAFISPFKMLTSILYKGKATVKNGLFEFEFIVPKDINYKFGNGKISYYCFDNNIDGTGYFNDIVIGGTDHTAKPDNIGPQIQLHMNDKNFVSGGITDENPVIYAELFDSNGINTTGNGIGHNISAVIDENTSSAIVLNNYYEADLNSYKKGKINYPMSQISDGNHTLSLKAWDVYNNSSERTIDFVVVADEKLAIDHVLNYPNPFTTRTQFFFEHNQTCEFLEVQIQVFTISGKLVKTINREVKTKGFRADAINWDGKDDYGDKIGRGTYVYKIKVVDDKGEKVEKFEKLVLLK